MILFRVMVKKRTIWYEGNNVSFSGLNSSEDARMSRDKIDEKSISRKDKVSQESFIRLGLVGA